MFEKIYMSSHAIIPFYESIIARLRKFTCGPPGRGGARGSILNQKRVWWIEAKNEDFNRTLLPKSGWLLATNQDKAWVHMLNAKLVYCMVSTYFFNIYIYIYISITIFF